MTAYTVRPGHCVTPPPADEWAPPTPPSASGVYQQANGPSLDTLYRVRNGLRRLDTHPAHQHAARLYGTAHP